MIDILGLVVLVSQFFCDLMYFMTANAEDMSVHFIRMKHPY